MDPSRDDYHRKSYQVGTRAPGPSGGLGLIDRADIATRSRDATRPRFAGNFRTSQKRGRRECRMRAAPAVSCAICAKECAHEHTGSAEAIRHSLRNGFTAYAALSPETNSSCLRRFANWQRRLNPVGHLAFTKLDASNGRRDHTVLPYATTSFVLRGSIAHSFRRPAISLARNAIASTAARTHVS